MRHMLFVLGVGLLLGTAGLAYAEGQSDLQTKVDALTARVAELEGQQSQTWLNERRAEEVKALVREVLSDADTRASLLESSMCAGHSDKGFFLASEDGKFLLTISGYTQIRYIWNHRQAPMGTVPDTFNGGQNGSIANNHNGFEIARMALQFDGYISSPKIKYDVGIRAGRDSETIALDHAKVSYDLMEGLTIWVGEDKDCFLREEMTGDTYQLAVDRSVVTQLFSLGRIQGVGLIWTPMEALKLQGTINDGRRSGESTVGDFGGPFAKGWENSQVDFSVTGRVDAKLAGTWAQQRDFTSWSGEPLAIFVGAAANFQQSKTGFNTAAGGIGGSGRNDTLFNWTVDASVESNGFNLYAAGVGSHFTGDDKAAGGEVNLDFYGAMIQGGYNIADKIEPFGRFEWIFVPKSMVDSGATAGYKNLHFVTAGVNYYIAKHTAKFTLDAVWAMEPVPAGLSTFGNMQAIGLLPNSAKGNEFVVRAQFQLMF
jgi:hypothetical protein